MTTKIATRQRGSASRSPKLEKPSRRRSPRVSSGRPSSRRWRRSSRLLDRLVLGGARLLQLPQLLRPLGGDRRGRLLALGVALGRRAGPLAQAADVAPLREGEQGKDAKAEEGGEAGERADLFDHLHARRRRGYSS